MNSFCFFVNITNNLNKSIMRKKVIAMSFVSIILMCACSSGLSESERDLKRAIEALNARDAEGIERYFEVSFSTKDLIEEVDNNSARMPQKISILKTKTNEEICMSWILTNTTFRDGKTKKIEYCLKVFDERGDWQIVSWVDRDFANERD